MLSLEEADDWMSEWSRRLSPGTFSLLGGEPTLHPDLAEFVVLARRHWPAAHLRLVTNGFFLHRHPDLPAVLRRDRDACLYLSMHHDAPEYLQKLRPNLELLERWRRDFGVRVETYRSFENWTRRYRGVGSAMKPFADGQPRQSWERCPAKYCAQLFEGKIWKCAPLAYLRMQDARHGLSGDWKPYLRYQPLAPSSTDEQLAEFFDREEEPSCAMCPADPERFRMPVPLRAAKPRSKEERGERARCHGLAGYLRSSGER